MSLQVKKDGSFSAPSGVYAKKDGTWSAASSVYTKKDGTWTLAWSATPVTTSVSMPIYHYNNYVDGASEFAGIDFSGSLKVFSDRNVHVSGALKSNMASSKPFHVWIGPNEDTGSLVTIATVHSSQSWVPITWTYSMTGSDEFHFVYGDDSGTYPRRKYIPLPVSGSDLPETYYLKCNTNAQMTCSVERVGANAAISWSYSADNSVGVILSRYWVSSSNTTFGSATHLNQVGSNSGNVLKPLESGSGVLWLSPYLANFGTNQQRSRLLRTFVPNQPTHS